MKITSVNNELIKETAKLLINKYREETSLFLIEGEKGVREALEAGIKIQNIFVLENYDKFKDENVIEVTEAVMAKISDAKSAPKVVAVANMIKHDKEDFKKFKKVVLLEDIKDAGNLGTILRTACAFNIDGIVLYGDTVDLYNPKTVRSAVGNLWKIPVISLKEFNELEKIFGKFERVATLPKSEKTINLENYTPAEKVLIMFGSEANGLSEKLKNFATENLTIEMSSDVESLNLSVSAVIIMYKLR